MVPFLQKSDVCGLFRAGPLSSKRQQVTVVVDPMSGTLPEHLPCAEAFRMSPPRLLNLVVFIVSILEIRKQNLPVISHTRASKRQSQDLHPGHDCVAAELGSRHPCPPSGQATSDQSLWWFLTPHTLPWPPPHLKLPTPDSSLVCVLWPPWLLAPTGEGTQTSQQINTPTDFQIYTDNCFLLLQPGWAGTSNISPDF